MKLIASFPKTEVSQVPVAKSTNCPEFRPSQTLHLLIQPWRGRKAYSRWLQLSWHTVAAKYKRSPITEGDNYVKINLEENNTRCSYMSPITNQSVIHTQLKILWIELLPVYTKFNTTFFRHFFSSFFPLGHHINFYKLKKCQLRTVTLQASCGKLQKIGICKHVKTLDPNHIHKHVQWYLVNSPPSAFKEDHKLFSSSCVKKYAPMRPIFLQVAIT